VPANSAASSAWASEAWGRQTLFKISPNLAANVAFGKLTWFQNAPKVATNSQVFTTVGATAITVQPCLFRFGPAGACLAARPPRRSLRQPDAPAWCMPRPPRRWRARAPPAGVQVDPVALNISPRLIQAEATGVNLSPVGISIGPILIGITPGGTNIGLTHVAVRTCCNAPYPHPNHPPFKQ